MKISVITINRNNAQGLEATIQSVLAQTNRAIEYIIIDGASTDNSTAIIEKYATAINYWVSEPDKGIYNAMNKGIGKAQGEYLIFLNSGDTLYSNTVLQVLENPAIWEDVVYGDLLFEGGNEPLLMPERITLDTFLADSIGHNASFIRRSLFVQYGLYNEENKIVSDLEFFLTVLVKHKCSYRHIKKVFTRQQKGGVSVTAANNQLIAAERMNCFRRVLPDFYPLIEQQYLLKEKLSFYEQSRPIQLLKRLQQSRLNAFKNKYIRFNRR